MKVESEIKKWGNSLALRVTGIMADLPNFRDGTKVIVEVSEGIMVKPAPRRRGGLRLPYTEEELLADLCPETVHADELAIPLATEVPLSRMEQPSVVAASLVQTLAWKERKVKKIITARQSEFEETLTKLLPLIGATELIESLL